MAHGRILLISDLHLDAAAPAAIDLFLRFLRDDAASSDGLYILGDLFESWIGDDDSEAAREQVCQGLRQLTQGGVACRVMHGNRDFLLGKGFAARTGCELLADPALLVIGGKRVLLSHGDQLCTGDTGYQRFRKLVRSRTFLRIFPTLPLALRRWLAGQARRRSSMHTRQLPESIMDVAPDAVAALLRDTNADMLIHGHTHRPGVHAVAVDGRERTRIVLGDWYEQGSLLELAADASHALRTLPMARKA